MVGCYHQLNEHELEQTLGDGRGQGGLVCCSPWGRKELDVSERLNSNKFYQILLEHLLFFESFFSPHFPSLCEGNLPSTNANIFEGN